jgi:putative two-component system response regulator
VKRILVVDDNLASLRQMEAALTGSYRVTPAKSGVQALKMCMNEIPDLILLDVVMPEMDGFEAMARLRRNPGLSHVPVIFLTGDHDPKTEAGGLSLGAVDFILKPVDRNVLLHRIGLHLRTADYHAMLERNVRELSDNLTLSVGDMIEFRDKLTGGHVARTSKYVRMLGERLVAMDLYATELGQTHLEMLERAAPLHDVGKIAVPDRILLKPGRLDEDEFANMKRHAKIGEIILDGMYARMPSQHHMKYAGLIAGSHHERYDGLGYPDGLKGDAIPLPGRIMAVADVYDALVCNRVYRKAMSHEEARAIILQGRGSNFDPFVVDAFEAIHGELEREAQMAGD